MTEAVCTSCGTTNPTGMTFCRQCGGRLEENEALPETVACPRCGRATPAGFNFCQHCGHKLAGVELAPSAPPTPPSGLPVSTSSQPGTPAPHSGSSGGKIRTPAGMGVVPPVSTPSGSGMGPLVQAPPPVFTASGYRGGTGPETPANMPNAVAGVIATSPAPGRPPPGPITAQPPCRLISVNRDGSDGVSFPVAGERFDIGRITGTLLFEDDGYLSDRHVRLELRGSVYHLVDLDSLNGAYVRIRRKEELRDGLRILVGMEVLRFELISEGERDPSPAVEHGVLVFGTPPKLPWARLRQITTAGICRDVYHLYRAEVVVGRESGDVVFSDDDFMSRMHAAIRNEGGKAWLVDLNSSNGTYVQVDGERALESGDFIRLGDQLLRFQKA